MSIGLLPKSIRDNYEVHEWKHACAVLHEDFPNEWSDIVSVLHEFRLRKSWITRPGGRKSRIAAFIDGYLYERRWLEREFSTRVVVDDVSMDTPNAYEQVVAAY